MATGKYHRWLEQDGIGKIVNWAAKGCTYAEMSNNMGINEATLYDWVNRFPQIDEAIKTGRAMAVQQVENQFFRLAMGLCEEVTETKDVEQRMVDGELVTVHRQVRTTVKKLPPNAAALIFYLKNHAGYRDVPIPDDDGSLEKVDALLEELRKA